ncbi:uncharacterized protein At4g26485-like [Vigna umbellata]|uniref:25S rRNA (uridine-N(3))-methyltransferase BMT5-like domain-containing protein n=1 Tax=Phaseolus angularis TaxID=3914 RepID=A0A0L9VN61_PHAAN|nr:uncharacterized protein At4g26485 [Vigna angularis]XP_047170930.1 uncharacterized protein At4g26485-like [Vigna umbellata]KAG2384159.1 uncharacterized protein HKW66_Vig0150780 [Vigna angularis]KOM56480.1 hypothetical protein LR48_Vigan10g237200 [Vigna angularis]
MGDKRIAHYRSSHKILLVGEGDFSFSLCLAKAFGTAINMVATSLDSRASLRKKYGNALRNLRELKGLGCTIVHGVDVHTMLEHPLLENRYFDRIIYNFPHAGFAYRESDDYQIKLHRSLVSGFFYNAKFMLNKGAEIHITHKTAHPFSKWNIRGLAKRQRLLLVEEAEFYLDLYPGYSNKRGDGRNSDRSFPIGECNTFMFMSYFDRFL